MADSSSMLEVILIPAEPDAIRAQAARNAEDPEAPWCILIAPKAMDFWLLWVETETLESFRSVSFDDNATTILLRLAVLLGDKWTDLWDDFDALIETQRQMLDGVERDFVSNALAQDFEDLVDWRKTMEKEPPTPGELLRHDLLGVKPIQGRN